MSDAIILCAVIKVVVSASFEEVDARGATKKKGILSEPKLAQ